MPFSSFSFFSGNKLEKRYMRVSAALKRKLKRGVKWKDLQKERDAMTRLAIAIHENHHQSYTGEKPLFGELNTLKS